MKQIIIFCLSLLILSAGFAPDSFSAQKTPQKLSLSTGLLGYGAQDCRTLVVHEAHDGGKGPRAEWEWLHGYLSARNVYYARLSKRLYREQDIPAMLKAIYQFCDSNPRATVGEAAISLLKEFGTARRHGKFALAVELFGNAPHAPVGEITVTLKNVSDAQILVAQDAGDTQGNYVKGLSVVRYERSGKEMLAIDQSKLIMDVSGPDKDTLLFPGDVLTTTINVSELCDIQKSGCYSVRINKVKIWGSDNSKTTIPVRSNLLALQTP